ncbi:hypothetical protein OROGR_017917 [Orobanche gracilis]
MITRVGDKVPAIRTFAFWTLARLANDLENNDILELFLEELQLEQKGEVRKIIVMSLPPSSRTLSVIIDSTLYVSELVRKAAYYVLASKYPLQSLRLITEDLRAHNIDKAKLAELWYDERKNTKATEDMWGRGLLKHFQFSNGDYIHDYTSKTYDLAHPILKGTEGGLVLREFLAEEGFVIGEYHEVLGRDHLYQVIG